MLRPQDRAMRARHLVFTALAIACATTGCTRVASEGQGALAITPGPNWKPIDPLTPVVPGKCLAAWSGPEGASLAMVKALPVPHGTARGLTLDLSSRLDNLPELRILKSDQVKIAGQDAARVEVVAPGFGDALAPSGLGTPIALEGKSLRPTRRINIGFARPDATYWIVFHYPESAASVGSEVQSILDSGVSFQAGTPSTY